MAWAHNGNNMNAYTLRGELEDRGSIFQTTADTEVLAHLIKQNGKKSMQDTLVNALEQIVGAYGFLVLTEDTLYFAMDALGIRPLSIGRLGDAFVVVSDTCSFDLIGASFVCYVFLCYYM